MEDLLNIIIIISVIVIVIWKWKIAIKLFKGIFGPDLWKEISEAKGKKTKGEKK